MLHLFISYFFLWKKTKRSSRLAPLTRRYGRCCTTFFSIVYIMVISVEFAWVAMGSVFYHKYIPEVHLRNFPLICLTYVICSWVEIVFLPSLFLFCTCLPPLSL